MTVILSTSEGWTIFLYTKQFEDILRLTSFQEKLTNLTNKIHISHKKVDHPMEKKYENERILKVMTEKIPFVDSYCYFYGMEKFTECFHPIGNGI